MEQPPGFMQSGLNGGSTDAGKSGNLAYRQIAYSVMFDLACDDAENGPLSLGVIMTKRIGQSTGPTESPAPIS